MTDSVLSFELANVRYEVPVGESVDVPDRYAYAIALQGIRLTLASEVEPEPMKPAVVADPAHDNAAKKSKR